MVSEEDKLLLERIQAGDAQVLHRLYGLFEVSFKSWVQKEYALPDAVAEDAFQEAVIQVYLNIKQGKLGALTHSLKSYVFEVGKFKALNLNKQDRKMDYFSDLRETKIERLTENTDDSEERLEEVKQALGRLGEPCKRLIELYYLRQYDMASVARELGFSGADSAKTQKNKCMRRLLEQLKTKSR